MLLSDKPLTLTQYLLQSNEPLVQAVTFSLIKAGIVLQDMPIATKPTIYVNGLRFVGNLPQVLWTPLNADAKNVSGTPSPYQEQVFILRESVDVDKYLAMDQNQITDPRGVQVSAALKAITYDFNNKFLNNDHVSAGGDVNSFVGLKYRINNGATYGVNSTGLIDAGGVDVSLAGVTASNANKLIYYLDKLLWAVDAPNGDPQVVLYMNDEMLRLFRLALRSMGTSGGLDVTKDQFDRVVETYKGCPIRDIGYQADQATRIIPITESAAGAPTGGTFTSIYAVNYSDEHFMGWQMAPLEPEDLGKILGTTYRTLIDWAVGVVNQSTRSIGRIFDIKVA